MAASLRVEAMAGAGPLVESSVPLTIAHLAHRDMRPTSRAGREFLRGGTVSSNPSPSSTESAANLDLGGRGGAAASSRGIGCPGSHALVLTAPRDLERTAYGSAGQSTTASTGPARAIGKCRCP